MFKEYNLKQQALLFSSQTQLSLKIDHVLPMKRQPQIIKFQILNIGHKLVLLCNHDCIFLVLLILLVLSEIQAIY